MTVDAADLTVIIPTRDRWPILHRTLDALGRQTVQGFAVLVVVDGEDQTVPALPPEVTVLQVPHGGPGQARNVGVAHMATPMVLFLGDDMIPTAHLVERHLARHNRDGGPTVAVLGGVGWHPEVPRTNLLRWIDKASMQFELNGVDPDDAGWGRFASCNVSMPRSLFDAAGGFDPDFTYYYEDTDFAFRLRDAGMVLRYERSAAAQHLHVYDVDRFANRLRGIAKGEHMLELRRPDFEPYFANLFRSVQAHAPYSPMWRRLPWTRRFVPAWLSVFESTYLDVYEGENELDELKAYLGDDYDEKVLVRHQQAVDEEEHAAADEATFYRTSKTYLYDLTAFAMWGTKRPYRKQIMRRVPPASRLLDYGCGIGSDGLRLLKAGYQVEFLDFDNPSVEYLRWRLARRGVETTIYDVEKDKPTGFDLAYCFDVIEHVDDPFGFLADIEATADLVAINFLTAAADDVHVHKPLPIPELLDHVTKRGLVHYSLLHEGRSHFVIYHAKKANPARRALGRLRRAAASR